MYSMCMWPSTFVQQGIISCTNILQYIVKVSSVGLLQHDVVFIQEGLWCESACAEYGGVYIGSHPPDLPHSEPETHSNNNW